jgi:hypothetical protein
MACVAAPAQLMVQVLLAVASCMNGINPVMQLMVTVKLIV